MKSHKSLVLDRCRSCPPQVLESTALVKVHRSATYPPLCPLTSPCGTDKTPADHSASQLPPWHLQIPTPALQISSRTLGLMTCSENTQPWLQYFGRRARTPCQHPCAGSRMAGSSPPCPLEAQARSHPPLGTGSCPQTNLQTPHSSLGPPQVHSHRCPHLPRVQHPIRQQRFLELHNHIQGLPQPFPRRPRCSWQRTSFGKPGAPQLDTVLGQP
mmetsp:Transcript_35459/g.67918  ORF Transcript_35459/g.67918 Transcript_35459/m.67918 type:complete len:214 (+) Transcript_35459:115-756(+)